MSKNLCACGRLANANHPTCCRACKGVGSSHTQDCTNRQPKQINNHMNQQIPFTTNEFVGSDHLPVLKTVVVNGVSLIILSWNVLFELNKTVNPGAVNHLTNYFNHIFTTDRQTRDKQVINRLVSIVGSNNVDIISLQEMDRQLLPILLQHLPQYSAVTPLDTNNDMQCILYKKAGPVTVDPNGTHTKYYVGNGGTLYPNKRIFNTKFLLNGSEFRFISTHVPFNEMQQLDTYLAGIRKPTSLGQAPFHVIISGDMNHEFTQAEAIKKNFIQSGDGQPQMFNYASTNPQPCTHTHINTTGKKVIYDHIFHIIN